MEQGWIKLHRKTLDNLFLMHDDNAFIVFTKLLLMVNKQGQIATGRNKLGEAMNMNPRTLYGVIIRLENQGLLNITSNTKYSILSICNWEKYQSSSTASSTLSQQRRNNTATTTQHYNKNKELRIKNKTVSSQPAADGSVIEIFDFYKACFNTPTTQLSKSRSAKIKVRLKDAGREMLLKAIENTSKSPHHTGDNDRGWKANIDFIIRSYEQVERLSELNVEAVSESGQVKPDLSLIEGML